MSQYVTLFVEENININQLHNVGLKNNLLFTPITTPSLLARANLKNMKFFLAEWNESEYGFAIEEQEEEQDIFCTEEILSLLGCTCEELSKQIEQSRLEKSNEAKKKRTYWENVLNEIFFQNPDEKIGLILHTFCGGVETEDFIIRRTVVIKCKLGQAQLPKNIEEDVIYFFSCLDGEFKIE